MKEVTIQISTNGHLRVDVSMLMFVDMGKSLSIILFFTFAAFGTEFDLETDSGQLTVPCIEDGRFYRNTQLSVEKLWYTSECSKYYLCLGGEVFEFRCSDGLLFDISRQICDFKMNVANCDISKGQRSFKPLLNEANCSREHYELGCADGTCIPADFFCDGNFDCPDDSDEEWCDHENDPNGAPYCNIGDCRLPQCFCSVNGTAIPGNLPPKDVPQMIILTFDDAVTSRNWKLFQKYLFTSEKTNPNGCPIRGTFFVSHQNTDYHLIQRLWNDGHEVAVHSITHKVPEDWWSNNATLEDWFDEMVGQANIINRFAGVPMEEIRGMRAPFLRLGWNRQFLMMYEFGFDYDSSIIAPSSNTPLWPYTLDYKIPHKCHGFNQKCPSRSYPSIWEMVINQFEIGEYTCTMIDSCPADVTGQGMYELLHTNFQKHFNSNRAPFGLHFRSAWFKILPYRRAFKQFITDIRQYPEVWFVTNQQAIQWMKNPKPLHTLLSFEPWFCQNRFPNNDTSCSQPNICNVTSKVLQGEKEIRTCFDCPPQYPWIRNEFGQF